MRPKCAVQNEVPGRCELRGEQHTFALRKRQVEVKHPDHYSLRAIDRLLFFDADDDAALAPAPDQEAETEAQ